MIVASLLRRAVPLLLVSCGSTPTTMPDPDRPTPCPEPASRTCGTAVCGARTNACGQQVSCGTCGPDEACDVGGQCRPAMTCVPQVMRACAGRGCGVWPDGCGGEVSCGVCTSGATCTAVGACVQDAGVPDGGAPDGGTAWRCPSTRSTVDRPDDSALPKIRLLYVLPSDAPDESLDVTGRICRSAQAFTGWLGQQLGGPTLRLDTANGELDIGFVRLGKTGAELRGSGNAADVNTGIAYVRERIERELRAMGQVKPDTLYAVFYGGESLYACGGAAYPPQLIGSVIAMYLKSTIGGVACEARPWGQPSLALGYYDWAMLHDVLHGLGIVPAEAPNHHSFGHAFDTRAARPATDLMYAPRSGMNDPPWAIDTDGGLTLDLNRDDYFDHDAGFVDLRRSAFLEPLPLNAARPPGW
ncbi:MAG: hypothetical protein JNJ54_26975 [Myxococcaceae bacterium]|nr:hypothetical protein [Myxococcaceae bacterium]